MTEQADGFYEKGEYQKAIEAYMAILNNPSGVDVETMTPLLNQVGLCHYFLEDYEAAANFFKQFLAALNKQEKPDESSRAIAMLNIANASLNNGEYKDALKYFLATLGPYSQFLDERSEEIISLYYNIGNTNNLLQSFEEGEVYYRKAIDLAEEVLGSDHESTIFYRYQLAVCYLDQGKGQQAFEEYKNVYYYMPEDGGNLNRIDVLNGLTNACLSIPVAKEHGEYFEQMVHTCVSVNGKESLNTAIATKKLGKWHRRMKIFPEAIKSFRISLDIHNKVKGELDPATLDVTDQLARACFAGKQYAEAQKYFTFFLSQERKKRGENDTQLLTAVANVAYSAYENKDLDEAQKFLEEANLKSNRINGPESPETIGYQHKLADVYYKRGKYDNAVEIIQKVIKINVSTGANNNLAFANNCVVLADNLKHLPKRGPEAAINYEKAIKLYAAILDEKHPRLIDTKLKLASLLYHQLFDLEKSLELLLSLLSTLESNQLSCSSYAQNALIDIGNIHIHQRDYTSALTYFHQALQRIEESGHPVPRRKSTILNSLASAELRLNKHVEAKAHMFEGYQLSCDQFGPKHPESLGFLKMIKKNFGEDGLEELNGKFQYSARIDEYHKFIHDELFSKAGIRNVRVFISSTFRDMMAERDHLMKNIFPSLKETCKKYGIEFSEVDLRWGITEEEASHGKVIEICLNEIDRSRPYFIGILGERYGWIPDGSVLSKIKRTLENFKWLQKDIKNELSITEMEIQYGVLRNTQMRGNAFFYLRDKSLTPGKEFQEQEGSPEQKKLQILKDGLRKQENYPVIDFSSVQQLGDFILHDLQKAIIRDTHLERSLSSMELAMLPHLNAIKRLCEFYLPVEETLQNLNLTLKDGNNKIILHGETGSGKSAMLSHWLTEKFRSNKKDLFLFHFAGADISGDEIGSLMERLTNELANCFLFENEFYSKAVNPAEQLAKTLNHPAINSRVIFVLDGIEKLKYKKFYTRLSWLPTAIPKNIIFIFSTQNIELLNEAKGRGFKALKIDHLQKDQNQLFIKNYLNKFGKKLRPTLIQKILDSQLSTLPLTLKIILDELKVFGKHEELEVELNKYLSSGDVKELFLRVLDRIENDYDENCPGLIQKALSVISITQSGLFEHEILEITNSAQLHWLPIQNALNNYLHSSNGLLSINNDSLLVAIRQKYLPDAKTLLESKHLLAQYFINSNQADRKVEELGPLLYELGDKENLIELITDFNIFRRFIKELKYEDLILYKNLVQDDYDLGKYYRKNLNLLQSADRNSLKTADVLLHLSMFLRLSNYFDDALYFAMESLSIRKKLLGENHSHTAEAMIRVGNIEKDNFDNVEKAKGLYQEAIAILEKNPHKGGLEMGMVYNSMSDIMINENQLDEAWEFASKSKVYLESILGKDNPVLAKVYELFGSIHFLRGNLDEAEKAYMKLMSLLGTSLGENHVIYQTSIINLIEIYDQREENQKALDLLIQSYPVLSKKLGKADPFSTTTKFLLASKYFQMEIFDKAAEHAMELMETAVEHQQLDAEYVSGTIDILKRVYGLRGQAHKIDELVERLGINPPNED